MKKHFFLLSLSLGLATFSFAQGTWTGTTTTNAVGIGTSSPVSKLEITASNGIGISAPSALKITNINGGGAANIMEVFTGNLTIPATPTTSVFAINRYGQVRVGSTAPTGSYSSYKLSVDGDIVVKRCVVQVSNWADYVFEPDYSMPSLTELETYVTTNKHLPGVPSAAEVADKGIETGEMNKILLQKVEELTLYMIDLKKENEQIKNELKELKSK